MPQGENCTCQRPCGNKRGCSLHAANGSNINSTLPKLDQEFDTRQSWRIVIGVCSALEEVQPETATGVVAALFARIRRESGSDHINLIWRHLATMPEFAEWAWSRASSYRDEQTVDRLAIVLRDYQPDRPFTQSIGVTASAIIATYRSNNFQNLVRVYSILASLNPGLDFGPEASPTDTAGPAIPAAPLLAELAEDDREAAIKLARLGPAGLSGVEPTVWRHIGVEAGLVSRIAEWLVPEMKQGRFVRAYRELLPRPTIAPCDVPAYCTPETFDRGVTSLRIFAQRLSEVSLALRALQQARP